MSSFGIEPHTGINKHFRIQGPGDLDLYVDYDDVNHEEVDRDAERMVEILNANWDNPARIDAARSALLAFMEGESEARWAAGWLIDLHIALLGDPGYELLVELAGGWWTYSDEWHEGTLAELKELRRENAT